MSQRMWKPRAVRFLFLIGLSMNVVPAFGEEARIAIDAVPDREARWTLEGALFRTASDGSRIPVDLHLDLERRRGEWRDDVWGYAMTYDELGSYTRSWGKSDHDGRLEGAREEGDETVFRFHMEFKGSGWNGLGTTTVAEGEYTLRVRREGETLAGEFRGTFEGEPVSGKARGRLREPPVRGIPEYRSLETGEHPRLIFRPGDLEEIRRRARETPEGRAMVARLEKRLDEGFSWKARVAPRHAAGHGFLYRLTGERSRADRAREIVAGVLAGKGMDRKMIRRAPRAMGVALAYDLCYDAWDDAFRRKVTAWLEESALDILSGGRTGGLNEHPYSNWMGIAYGSAGVIALAILGEPGDYPDPPVAPVKAAIEPPEGFEAPEGVPVVRYEEGKMPRPWIMAGPFETSAGDDFLASIGGRSQARPRPGTEVRFGGETRTFRAIGDDAIWVQEYFTYGDPALDLLVPIDRAYFTTSYYYNVLDSREPGWYRLMTDTRAGGRNATVWIAGRRLAHGDLVRLEEGLYPVMVETSVGTTTPWGRILAAPRLVPLGEDEAAREHAERTAAHEKALARWRSGRERWVASGRTVPTARYSLRRAERGVRRFLEMAIGDRGFGIEGEGYLRFTMTCGLLQFLHGWRTAAGKEFTGLGSEWLLVLPVITGVGPEGERPAYGPAGWSDTGQQEERSGEFALGLSNVRPEHLPAVKWWFDRTYGLEGNRTFNIFMPSQAAYALVNYPFGVEARNPGDVLPRFVQDSLHGYFAFRRRWEDEDDILSVMHLKSRLGMGVHQANPAGSVRIVGFGRPWAEIPKVEVPGSTTRLGGLGGVATHFAADDEDGWASVSADLDRGYLVGDGKDEPLRDAGVRGLRALAVDYSGLSGKPGLWALVDRVRGAEEKAWVLRPSGKVSAEGRSFTAGGRDGPTLRGTFLAPRDVRLDVRKKGLRATGTGDLFFVVLTLGDGGSEPEVARLAESNGIAARVGKRVVRFDGERIVLGED